jgi:hypothetical protein
MSPTASFVFREFGTRGAVFNEAWAVWHRVIREYLQVPDNQMIFCGMALGHADETASVNALESERAALEEFALLRDR